MKKLQKFGLAIGAALGFGAACHTKVLVDSGRSVTISGTVLDPSGAPDAGAEVSFHPGYYPDAPLYAQTITDENGRYKMIVKVPPQDDLPWDGPICPTNSILARDLKGNLAAIEEFIVLLTNMDLKLQPGITSSGLVNDAEGAPVSTAWVSLSILVDHSFHKLEPQPVMVNAQGAFSIPALPQGYDYECVCGATGYAGQTVWLRAKDAQTNQLPFQSFVLKFDGSQNRRTSVEF